MLNFLGVCPVYDIHESGTTFSGINYERIGIFVPGNQESYLKEDKLLHDNLKGGENYIWACDFEKKWKGAYQDSPTPSPVPLQC